MNAVVSLPDELLSCIFDLVDSTAQLAACRLVCRKWNFLAETTMFGKKITIKSEKQAIALYGRLCRDPSKGRLIKHLDFNISVYELPAIYYYLLDLAFTPTIEQLTGFVQAKDFFTALTDIVDSTTEEFIRLTELPKNPAQNVALQAMIKLGVRKATLTIGDDFHKSNAPMFGKFSNLTELEIIGSNRDWQSLDTILKYCPDLMALKFRGLELDATSKSIMEVSNWLAANVVKQMNLQRLEFKHSTIEAGMAEYFKYKYPNIKVTKCDGYNSSGCTYNPSSASLHRILNALRDLHVEQATLMLSRHSDLMLSLEFAQRRKEDIKFQIDQGKKLVMKVKFAQTEN